MNRIDFIKNFLLAVLSSASVMLSAHHIVLQDSQGQSFVLDLHSEDRFIDVINSIHAFRGENSVIDEDEVYTFQVSIPAKKNLELETLSKKPKLNDRSFAAGITQAEAADISFILKTMANSSLPKIKAAETSLKKAGERIAHVHPFFFLSTIFTDEELKVCVRNLQGRAWVWKEFLRGIVDSLSEEHAKDNILPFVNDFVAIVKVDPSMILPSLQANRWERFVNILIDVVPREGSSDRYDM